MPEGGKKKLKGDKGKQILHSLSLDFWLRQIIRVHCFDSWLLFKEILRIELAGVHIDQKTFLQWSLVMSDAFHNHDHLLDTEHNVRIQDDEAGCTVEDVLPSSMAEMGDGPMSPLRVPEFASFSVLSQHRQLLNPALHCCRALPSAIELT